MEFRTFGFIGLGLIGGSLARSFRKANPDCVIYAYDKDENSISQAIRDGLINGTLTGPGDPLLGTCDMILLCAPVGRNIAMLHALKEAVRPDCLITDAGSVKTGIHKAAVEAGLTAQFIGGHPMAGSEKSGFANSSDHLFENAYYILTPEPDVPETYLQAYLDLVRSIHALPLVLSCEEHDYITAAVSHLPHVIASSLVNTVHNLDNKEEHMKMIAAGGFRDITRIASSSPEMWEQICLYNHDNIARVMDEFIRLLTQARDHMMREDGGYIRKIFTDSGDYRNSFDTVSHGSLKKNYRIYCDIIDESGAIATIATILAVGRINIKNIGIIHNREFEEGVLKIEFYEEEAARKAAAILQHHRYQVWEV